jgi:Uma2 family endonuclease
MIHLAEEYEDLVPVPRAALELPLPLPLPPGFDPDRLETWPKVAGRLEYVGGRLLFMPPCGDWQQDTCADVVGVLSVWRKSRTGFVVGANEAGILLAGETRGADAAVWRERDVSALRTGGLRRTPPILVVEVAGKYDDEEGLRDKAAWYRSRGTATVWLLFPIERRVVRLAADGEQALSSGQQLPPDPELPGLTPPVDDLFEQVSRRPDA